METVDLSRFRKTGEGANGESYDSIDDPNLMLKLYNETYPMQPVIDELEVARKVYELGVPSPEPGELVKYGNRLGIKFRKVVGKRSYSRALADEPERVDEYAREFARYCKALHATECPEGMFPKEKDLYLGFLDADKILTPEERVKLRRFIEGMPDCMTATHGDMHMGNLLTTLPKGAPMSTPHDVYFIDLGYFATGTPLLDVAMLMSVCLFSSKEFLVENMHIDHALAHKFWAAFVDVYFDGRKPEEVEPMLMPYVATKLLLVEYNLGGWLPENYLPVVRKATAML